MSHFQTKTVIVTGAGTGIGRAVARDFVQAGARVAFIGRRMDKLAEAAAELPEVQVLRYSCDVSDRQAVNAIVQEVSEQFGPVDILVNNAGINTNPRSVAEVDPADWDRTIAINLTGAFNFVRAVLPAMRQRKSGVIVNVSSIAGLRAGKLSGAAYSASKHGMVALTHSINEEEVEYGIRACVICPGEVETPILELRPEPVSAERRATMLQPEDVSAAVLFVAGLHPRACVPELIIKPTTQIYR
jgi:NAD(P)-dependent dehydrogenase (short-subunit alcohol dehydrogenase family)